MTRWQRNKESYLVKSRTMTEGQLLHMLLGKDPSTITELDERFYESFQALRESSNKALVWVVGAASFAILALLDVLESASAGGLEVEREVFSHVALVALSASATAFCFAFSKQSLATSWFSWKFRSSSSYTKAECLLKFPDAYFYFYFLPSAIGCPPHVFSERRVWPQVVTLALAITALVIFAMGSIVLWANLAIAVWSATTLSTTTTVVTLSLSTTLILLGWTAPFYRDAAHRYTHHGLVTRLSGVEGDRLKLAHFRIYRAARQMGLVDDDVGSK